MWVTLIGNLFCFASIQWANVLRIFLLILLCYFWFLERKRRRIKMVQLHRQPKPKYRNSNYHTTRNTYWLLHIWPVTMMLKSINGYLWKIMANKRSVCKIFVLKQLYASSHWKTYHITELISFFHFCFCIHDARCQRNFQHKLDPNHSILIG